MFFTNSKPKHRVLGYTATSEVISPIAVVDTARDQGVVVNNCLTMANHVSSTCQTCYLHPRQLIPVIRFLTVDAAKTAVQLFITLRIDYCNSMFYGLSDIRLRRLQSVQNAATVPPDWSQEHCDMSTSLQCEILYLHWLPVRQRVDLLVYNSRHGLALTNLSQDCRLVSPSSSFSRG